jgi:hypothetical protein
MTVKAPPAWNNPKPYALAVAKATEDKIGIVLPYV